MAVEKSHSDEALALERVAAAAREVQAASTALKAHFAADGGRQLSTLELARFAAAMQELKDAREAFDLLIVGGTEPQR
jgi:phage tail sheath gpL-like